MARPEIDPTLQLRNQESVRLTDTEVDRIKQAVDSLNVSTGYKVSRSAFIKVCAMREVDRILVGEFLTESPQPNPNKPTKRTHKAASKASKPAKAKRGSAASKPAKPARKARKRTKKAASK